MTLCIAAACMKDTENRIIVCADRRTEIGWASGNVGWKFSFASTNWLVLFAGDESKAAELINTLREFFKDEETLTYESVSDKLNEASAAHKRKLCERYVEQTWGITFERFLSKGKAELTTEVRNRIWHDIGELEFDCDLIVVGFTSGIACLLGIQSDGEVLRYENFAATGTGKLIAESVLFQREQQNTDSFRRTLYNVYEAARLGRIAPGVGETDSFIMLAPPVADLPEVGVSHLNRNALNILEATFQRVGPKALTDPPEITDEHFNLSDWGNIQTAKGLEVITHGSKPPRNP